MEQALNEEEEDFWDFKGNREKSPHFEAKSKKDEFNINNKREEINNNEQEELKQQSHGHIETDERKNEGAEERSVRIEKLIKSLDKLKPTHTDKNEISEGQKSNAHSGNDDRRFGSLANENHINSVGDDRSRDGSTDATTDSDGSGSDRETHGITSKDKKRKRDLKLDDGKSKSNNTDRKAADEDVVPAQDSWTERSNETDEAKSLNGNETFIDYGFPDEGSQLTRDSPVTASDHFEVHPPKSGAPHRSRRKTRKPNAVAKTSKRSHHGVNGQDQQPVKDNDDQGESCDEIQSPKLSQGAESSSGKENASTPKAAQKRRSRNRRVKPMRSSSPEDLGKDGTGGETEGSRSPPRMRKELRSGDYDWSLSGNEEVRDWVKKKNRMARKQKAEDRRKERLKKQEAEGIGLVGDQERKSVESLQRKKKPKPKQRSSSCPGDGGVSDREVLPRSKSQPRMSKELRSGGFDWSTSKNEEIRVWLKKKKRLLLKQRAEERKKEKMKKKEEEQKRKEHEEMYADSSERVSEWMKLKRRQEYLSKKRQKEEQVKAEQENEKVMIIGRRMNYEPVLTEPQANAPEKQEASALRTDQKQENVLRVEPLLKQREKQRRLLLSTGPKQPINLNKTPNLRIESVSKHTANQTQQGANAIEEITLQNVATVTSLPSADKRSNVKTPVRRLNEPVVLPRQSLSPSKVNVPTGNVRVSTEPENIKKKITFDEWLNRKKVDDERKRLAEQAAKEQGKNLEELSKSVEIKKMNLTTEKKSVPTGSRENLSKRATRPKSALRQERQPQVKLEQESVTSQQQESAEKKPNEADGATVEDVADVNQLVAEASENSTKPSRSKGTRSNESDMIAASEMVTDKVPNPYIIGGSNIPATVLRAKSPKPKVAVRPTLRSVKYQQGSWERFSNYLWDQVNEEEGAELTTSREKLRLEPMGAEADKIETSFEKKPEKLEDISREDEKVEASADTREESEYRESTLDRSLELNSGENIEGEISKVPYRGNQVNEHLQDLEARGRNQRELEDLLNKNEKSKLPFQTKEVDDNFHESDLRNCREVVASGLIHEKEESQLVTRNERESNSILTVETDGGFGKSGARKENILTIIDAEDEETETELEDKTKAELKMDAGREIRMESKSEEHEQRCGTEKNKERGTALPHVHFSDSEEEIVSDLEFSGSNVSIAD